MIIRGHGDLLNFFRKALSIDLSKGAWEFKADKYKPKRSAEQNGLAFIWYAELGKHTGSGKDYERNFCKWTFGCPILVESDRKFSEFYESLINKYEYEQCIESMEYFEVTRLFNASQFTEYLKHIELYAAEQGYQLTKPVDKYHLAMGIEEEEKNEQRKS